MARRRPVADGGGAVPPHVEGMTSGGGAAPPRSSPPRVERKKDATRERTGKRARCRETWGGAPGKTRGSGCPPPPRRLPNGAIFWPVASFLAGFSPRKKAGIPEGFPAAKVGLSVMLGMTT